MHQEPFFVAVPTHPPLASPLQQQQEEEELKEEGWYQRYSWAMGDQLVDLQGCFACSPGRPAGTQTSSTGDTLVS
jgi:hypothetical protein